MEAITRPSFIIREVVCRNNIRRMAEKAESAGVLFRPHFKTHQSLSVGRWFRDQGVNAITVSSADMAMQFAYDGWDNITIAFPVNLREIEKYRHLASGIDLNLIVDSEAAAAFLGRELSSETGIFIEVDCGYPRSGVPAGDYETFETIAALIEKSKNLNFKGFITHAGNTYRAGSAEEVAGIYEGTLRQMNGLKSQFTRAGNVPMVSIGDTPACSIVEDLSGADEIRPGNFVYYDLMQYYLGACSYDDIAVTLACPVSGIYPSRSEIMVYGGAVHLSKEHLCREHKIFGEVVRYGDDGWTTPLSGTYVSSLSQEHGLIKTHEDVLGDVRHGDLLGILPVHSCLTANLMKDHTLLI